MEHTTSIIETDISLIPSLLKFFEMFQLRLSYDKHNEEDNVVEDIDIKCRNCHRRTGLFLKDKTVEELITILLLNIVLHHVGLSCIISSNKQIK